MMRYKIQISAPATLSFALFVVGLLAILLYSLEVFNGESGTGFMISITLQTLTVYLVSLALCSFLLFTFLKRKGK